MDFDKKQEEQAKKAKKIQWVDGRIHIGTGITPLKDRE